MVRAIFKKLFDCRCSACRTVRAKNICGDQQSRSVGDKQLPAWHRIWSQLDMHLSLTRRSEALLFFAVLHFLLCPSTVLADPADLSETEERSVRARVMPVHSVLSPAARQLADELELLPRLAKLQALSEHDRRKREGQTSHENTSLRLELTESVITTMLQCQQVIVEIDGEISEASEYMAVMSARRDKAIAYNNLAQLVANGLVSTAGNYLQMPQTINEQPGEVMETGASTMSGGLGALAMYQQAGEKLSAGIRPNMLAKIFKRPNNEQTEYPDVIWTYLNSNPPGQSKSRRELLIDAWERLGRIPARNTPAGLRYIRILSGTIPQRRTVTLSMLDDRTAMLGDLRAVVGQIYKELLNLMLVVRAL